VAGPVGVVLGLLAVAVLPGAIAASRFSTRFDLLDASAAIPLAALLGVLAIVCAGRARRSVRSLRPGGETVATLGKVLGLLGLCLALTASISVGFYELLVKFQ
jgi:hypothetical protein